jgi:hypothetical protein
MVDWMAGTMAVETVVAMVVLRVVWSVDDWAVAMVDDWVAAMGGRWVLHSAYGMVVRWDDTVAERWVYLAVAWTAVSREESWAPSTAQWSAHSLAE